LPLENRETGCVDIPQGLQGDERQIPCLLRRG
jgi:hypothetical protein